MDAAAVHTGAFCPARPGFHVEFHRDVEHAVEHGLIHRRDGVVAAVGIGREDDEPLGRQFPGDQFIELKQLHDSAEDPVVGAVHVVKEQDTGPLLSGRPIGRREAGHVALVGRF